MIMVNVKKDSIPLLSLKKSPLLRKIIELVSFIRIEFIKMLIAYFCISYFVLFIVWGMFVLYLGSGTGLITSGGL